LGWAVNEVEEEKVKAMVIMRTLARKILVDLVCIRIPLELVYDGSVGAILPAYRQAPNRAGTGQAGAVALSWEPAEGLPYIIN
jgi:hypothetical protein